MKFVFVCQWKVERTEKLCGLSTSSLLKLDDLERFVLIHLFLPTCAMIMSSAQKKIPTLEAEKTLLSLDGRTSWCPIQKQHTKLML